ncbi:hypothetical protein OIO90_004749 [Microbotryomycetes sp. JL221]|nr:hypothetical protein OIO90_004749 [Microbotryomycetes sp. JL221]
MSLAPPASSALSRAHVLPPDSLEKLWTVADEMLQQIIDMLDQVVQRDDQLKFESSLIPGSTIGKHLRLLLDACEQAQSKQDERLFSSSTSSSSTRSDIHLSYDVRSRNVESEESCSKALESFQQLQHRLAKVTSKGKATTLQGDRKVVLNAVTPFVVTVTSSFARELWFCMLHATHHLALLRVIVVGELGLELPPTFGTAPSTLVQRTTREQQHRMTDESPTKTKSKL